MFKIVILQVVVAAVVAGPIYTGGMGYGGIGTSTVSVSRRTSVVSSPGMYGGGMMTPGMGMYGGGIGLAPLVDEKTASETVVEKQKTVGPAVAATETIVEKDVVTPVEEAVEVVKTITNESPMGQIRTGVVGGMGMATPGVIGGAVSGSSRTDVVRAGIGGVEKSSVGESHVSTPFGSQSSVSSVQERASGLL